MSDTLTFQNSQASKTSDIIIDENFNLFDTLLKGNNIDNAYEIYKILRDKEPVFYMKSSTGFLSENMWILTKYSDINSVLASKKFGRGTKITQASTNPALKNRKVNSLTELKQNWVTFLDPPEHSRLRGFLNKTFTPKLINNFKPRINDIVNYLIDNFESKGEFEMINDFSYPMAAIAIAEILGVPPEERHLIENWAHRLVKMLDGVAMALPTDTIMDMYKAADEIKDYFQKIVSEKNQSPKDDLISSLLKTEISDDRLTETEVMATAVLLIMDAHESIKNLIGNGMYALLQNSSQLDLLKSDFSLTDNAVDEFLRYDSPGQFTGRRAHEDFEIKDKLIKKGSQVICMLGAGNRDADKYENPDTLDITRKNINPLSFGGGIHYCAGALLAKLEAVISFETLLKRLPDIKLKNSEYHYTKTLHGRGLQSLELKF